MVLVIYRNNGISALRIHLVCCVCIHRNLYIVLVDCVPFRCIDFLNPVMSDFEVNITEHHPNEPQIWRVLLDEEFKAKQKIVKKDDETKKSVLIA